MDLLQFFHPYYWIDVMVLSVTPIYIIWTFLAMVSKYSSLLSTIASRGKTRHLYHHDQHNQQHINNETTTSIGKITTTTTKTSSSYVKFVSSKLNKLSSTMLWVPKSYFSHFYNMGLACTLLAIIIVYVFVFRIQQQRPPPTPTMIHMYIVWLLTLLHLVRRKYECIYVHQWTPTSTMHVLTYLGGMMHYMILPLVTIIIPIRLDDTMDHHRNTKSSEQQSSMWVVWSMSIISLNLYAQYEQYQHHVILANLRLRQKQNQRPHVQDQVVGVKKDVVAVSSCPPTFDDRLDLYRIPTERWFHYIACPHYFAEILIYMSLAILIDATIPSSAKDMAKWNLSNAIRNLYDNYSKQEQIHNDEFITLLIECIYCLFYWSSLYRHWWLVLWVTSNLSISAYTNLEWNRRTVLLVLLLSSSPAVGNEKEEETCSIIKDSNPKKQMLDMMRSQKAIIPWIY